MRVVKRLLAVVAMAFGMTLLFASVAMAADTSSTGDQLAPVFGLIAGIVVAFGPLAIGLTKLVDGLRLLLDRTPETPWPGWIWIGSALVIAIVSCLAFEVNVAAALIKTVPAFNQSSSLDGTWGQVVTAVGMAGMASYWHEHMSLKAGRAAEARSNTTPSG